MINITLISSVINISSNHFSYTNTRSVFTREERYDQTKRTIETIKEKIPNNKIMLIECSKLNEEETNYINENVDYFFNLNDLNDEDILSKVNHYSKSLGEGTLTIYALRYLFMNNIPFDNLFKISGRYWLNDHFDYSDYSNYKNISRLHPHSENVCITIIYKITYETSKKWLDNLLNSNYDFYRCETFETIFKKFMDSLDKDEVVFIKELGVSGNIAVDGVYVDY
jgi:hypothetical protein